MNMDAVVASCLTRLAPAAWAAYVFGSAGTEWERPDSDVDVAVLTGPTEVNLGALREALERELGRDIDLIDLRTAPTVLKKEVVTTGRLVWQGDPLRTAFYEVEAMGEYQHLCQERADIVADGLASGRFYA